LGTRALRANVVYSQLTKGKLVRLDWGMQLAASLFSVSASPSLRIAGSVLQSWHVVFSTAAMLSLFVYFFHLFLFFLFTPCFLTETGSDPDIDPPSLSTPTQPSSAVPLLPVSSERLVRSRVSSVLVMFVDICGYFVCQSVPHGEICPVLTQILVGWSGLTLWARSPRASWLAFGRCFPHFPCFLFVNYFPILGCPLPQVSGAVLHAAGNVQCMYCG
jgi:hypothetical protein